MCYTVPVASAIVTTLVWKKSGNRNLWWLNLMLYGGAIFGIIDHLWNGELFLISDKLFQDLMLGVVITLAIGVAWVGLMIFSRVKSHLPQNQLGKV